jgi:hypothetical protein
MFHSKRKIFCDARLAVNSSLTAKKLRAKIAQKIGKSKLWVSIQEEVLLKASERIKDGTIKKPDSYI